MSVPDKNISRDLYTTDASQPVYKNDFYYYWNGGIPEIPEVIAMITVDETSGIDTDTLETENSHTTI